MLSFHFYGRWWNTGSGGQTLNCSTFQPFNQLSTFQSAFKLSSFQAFKLPHFKSFNFIHLNLRKNKTIYANLVPRATVHQRGIGKNRKIIIVKWWLIFWQQNNIGGLLFACDMTLAFFRAHEKEESLMDTIVRKVSWSSFLQRWRGGGGEARHLRHDQGRAQRADGGQGDPEEAGGGRARGEARPRWGVDILQSYKCDVIFLWQLCWKTFSPTWLDDPQIISIIID